MQNKTYYITDAIDEFFKNYSKLSLKQIYTQFDKINIPSLRLAFLDIDLEMFSEISEILSIITSIAVHPFVDNKREEVIVKSGLASNLSSEAFQKTMSDSKLWKRHGKDMLPEEVYYYQYYDELRTYENIFVVTVTESIASYLERSRNFYSRLVQSIDIGDQTETFNNAKVENILELIDKAIHRLSRVQKTYFYKVVSKSSNRIHEVTPTNILVQNYYYNRVYKFYKDMIKKTDATQVNSYYLMYVTLLMLREFKSHDLKLLSEDFNILDANIKDSGFEIKVGNKQLEISVNSKFENNALEVTVNDLEVNYVTKNILIADVDDDFLASYIPNSGDYVSATYISPRNIAHLHNGVIEIESPKLTGKYGLTKVLYNCMHSVVYGKESIYTSICPCCTSRHIDSNEDVHKCLDCQTTYKITPTEDENVSRITFGYLRRK